MNQIVPLDSSPNQSFRLVLNVDNNPLSLRVNLLHYNEIAGYWVATISDANNNLLLDSVPLLTGDFPAENILNQFAYLQIGSAAVINYSQSPKDHPDNTDLGGDFVVVWGNTPKVGQA